MALDPGDRDTLIGAGVMAVGAVVLALTYGTVGRATVPGYDLMAAFNKAEGIGVGSDVRLSGVSVGKVVAQRLDDRFRAVLTLRLTPAVILPDDTSAAVHTDGLMGAKYITLQPGGDEANLKPGDRIRFTQDSLNLQDLLQLIIAQGEAKRAEAQAGQGNPAGAPPEAAPRQEVPDGAQPH